MNQLRDTLLRWSRPVLRLAAFAVLVCGSMVTATAVAKQSSLTAREVATSLTQHALQNRFPSKLQFTSAGNGKPVTGNVSYTFDQKVHQAMADVYLRYQPDYACFVALDVDSGAILNLTSFIKSDEQWDNLVMRADYPAASVFKLVTAAAGLDMGKLSPATIIPFNGKATTLYKSQVLRHKDNKWTRTPTFKEAFAKSVNPVFGRVGVFRLGANNLSHYADRFGFDREMQTDFLLPPSQLRLKLEDEWEIAEAASGFTRDITLSPIHAAQMASIVVNDGKMVVPYMVESVVADNGKLLYRSPDTRANDQVISPQTAKQLRQLMQETTRIGSARKQFRGLKQYKVYKGMEIGGKTGSLTGYSPRGRHDWFVGYAEKGDKRVAYASLIINKEKWYVRSAYVARQFIYNYFKELENSGSLAASN